MAGFNIRVWRALKILDPNMARLYFFGRISAEDAIREVQRRDNRTRKVGA